MKNIISMLPQECISHIISITSPCDACTSSLVSSVFREAADSNIVWRKFLPEDIEQIVSKSLSPSASSLVSISKKDLYFYFRNHCIIIDGPMSFGLDQQQMKKKRYMIGARGLSIAGGDTLDYLQWTNVPASRFGEVAELKNVLGLDIKTDVKTKMLSSGTTYAAYFVYQLLGCRFGFAQTPIEFRVHRKQNRVQAAYHGVVLDPSARSPQTRDREDGWMEVEMGEFFISEEGDDDTMECSVRELSGTKSGLLVEGVELRPKLLDA